MKLKKLISQILNEKLEWEKSFGDVFFRVVTRTVIRQRPNGTLVDPFNYVLFDRGNSVSGIVLIKDTDKAVEDKIVMVRQYRAGADRYLLDLPAGMVDEGEDPAVAVVREVMEETGFDFVTMQHLRHIVLSPGSYTEQADIFLFTTSMDLKKGHGGGRLEESEEIEIVYVPVSEAISAMRSGEITDAKTVIALMELERMSLGK